MQKQINTIWWTLRVTYGLVPIIAGLDKFFYFIADWDKYLAPFVTNLLAVSPETFIHVVGVVEILAGLMVFSQYVKVGAYLIAAWLVLIAVNLVVHGGYLDIAVRDLVIAVSVLCFAWLTNVRNAGSANPA